MPTRWETLRHLWDVCVSCDSLLVTLGVLALLGVFAMLVFMGASMLVWVGAR